MQMAEILREQIRLELKLKTYDSQIEAHQKRVKRLEGYKAKTQDRLVDLREEYQCNVEYLAMTFSNK